MCENQAEVSICSNTFSAVGIANVCQQFKLLPFLSNFLSYSVIKEIV